MDLCVLEPAKRRTGGNHLVLPVDLMLGDTYRPSVLLNCCTAIYVALVIPEGASGIDDHVVIID